MPANDPPGHNRHGREIWFKDNGEGYGPVHRKGCIIYLLCSGWILFCAGVGVALFGFTNHLGAFVVPFVLVAPGLLLIAATVRRHS